MKGKESFYEQERIDEPHDDYHAGNFRFCIIDAAE
jgi:hypothetical protein